MPDIKELHYFFKPINLGRGAMPSAQKAIFQNGRIILVDAISDLESRGRKTNRSVYDEWFRRRKESFRRIYKAPNARLKIADKNRKIVYEIAKKLIDANPKKFCKKAALVTAVHSKCIGKSNHPRDRKTITKFVNEYLFISLR